MCAADFKLRAAFVETDPTASNRADIADSPVAGEYDHPLRVVAVDLAQGRAHDVSEGIAAETAALAAVEGQSLPPGTRDFVARANMAA